MLLKDVDVLRYFDPWKSKICTCKLKYSFNPYTGCSHRCVYCYATYIPKFYHLRKKKNVVLRLEKDLRKADLRIPVSMSNSSDPYPPVEKKECITRKCLEVMRDYGTKLLLVTKSDIVVRDVDILSEMNCCVSVTVTGFKFSRVIEPFAPDPEKRIKAMKILKDSGIPVVLRLDPVLPYVNEDEVENVISMCDFVDHVVTSTLKLKQDSLKRIISVLPHLEGVYKELYLKKGKKVGSSYYLPDSARIRILKKVEDVCNSYGLSCAFCREGVSFKAASCDGQHLLK